MKVVTHGSVGNFQESVREMFIADLEQLISNYQEKAESVLLGTVDLHKEEVRVFGHLKDPIWDEEKECCELRFTLLDGTEQRVSHPLNWLKISRDAAFDIIDNENKSIHYQVVYLTFQENEEEDEVTYFLAHEGVIEETLACVAEFWQHVCEVGQDVDFTIVGCRAKAFCT